MRVACPIVLTDEERQTLERWSRGRSTPTRQVLRAKIVLWAADGMKNKDIAPRVGTDRLTVARWRSRFAQKRLAGIAKDAPRSGRKPTRRNQVARLIVERTTQTRPANATHWTTRTLADELGVSPSMVLRVWQANNLKPHLTRTFKLSNDPAFVEQLVDVVGLYLNPPEHALVLCADEKSQIQALDRTQPLLPMRPGVPARQTHDYKRNGTTTLFAALSMLDGKVIGDCMPRHRHQEFVRFLKRIDAETPAGLDLHLIVDNYGTHKHARVQDWLARHPRFHLHFTPTSSSWLNLVKRWFREITDKRIRRGSFHNVQALIDAINGHLDNHNQNPRVFVWSAPFERILAKIAKCKEALDALH